MKLKYRAAALAGAAIALGTLGGIRADAATTTTHVVTEADVVRQPENTPPTNNWVLYNRNTPTAVFEDGPAAPPLGTGSLGFVTPTGADKVTLFNYDHVGTALAGVDAIAYDTYRNTGNDQQVAALNIEVDVNGSAAGGFTTLVFEPVYNTTQGAVLSGQWQHWNAYNGGNGIWWSSNPIPGAPNRDTFVPWSTIRAANPNAVIIGGVGVNQGSGNPALDTNVDALIFGAAGTTDVYNFERVYPTPTDKDQCKNGGWQQVSNNGTAFKNQGDCVSFVASKGKN